MPNLMQGAWQVLRCSILHNCPPSNPQGVFPPKALPLLLSAELKASGLPVQNRGITWSKSLCSLANTRSAFFCKQTPSPYPAEHTLV